METQTDFNDFETQEIESLKNRKTIDVGKISFRRRIYSAIASFVVQMMLNFGTKLRWQTSLVTYLVIVCPIGTYHAIKFIINLF